MNQQLPRRRWLSPPAHVAELVELQADYQAWLAPAARGDQADAKERRAADPLARISEPCDHRGAARINYVAVRVGAVALMPLSRAIVRPSDRRT
jgi:hypothetical protein